LTLASSLLCAIAWKATAPREAPSPYNNSRRETPDNPDSTCCITTFLPEGGFENHYTRSLVEFTL
jgi:hypothetical protein